MLIKERYRLIKLVAQGGFGKTFFAVDEGQSPPILCVIKQFWLQNQTSLVLEQATELFKQESLQLKELGRHPQIPALLDYFEENQHFYLVQEFIEGTNLAKIVEEEGTFSESQIWQVLAEILPVLRFIHGHRVIHRDIKPENIIRRASPSIGNQAGQLVLVDFSAAKLVTAIDAINIDASIGSAEYVAPEQAQGKAVFASDLYSLGVTCIYLLTGTSPFNLFDGANRCWIWRQYITEEVSENLAQILDKLIQNSLNQRFQSADEVLQAIERLISTTHYPLPATHHPLPRQKWECIRTLTGHSGLFAGVNSVAISPDNRIVASASDDKTVRLWSLETGEAILLRNADAIATLVGHSHFVKSVAFSPDGTRLATGSDDKTIKLWDVETGEEICTLVGHSHAVKSVAFSPILLNSPEIGVCGGILASGSWDKTIKLWDISSAEVICTLTGHQLQVTSVAFSPDGQYLASASFDRTVRLWDLGSRVSPQISPQLRYTLTGHSWPVFSVAFSPNSKIIATGSDDKTIKLWDLNVGRTLCTLSSHSWSVVALAFNPKGETLVSGSWDKTLKLWRVSTGEELATLTGHSDSVCAVAMNSDGSIIASASKDKTIKLWRLLEQS